MAKKRGVIATFKTLGASSRLVLAVYLIQALMLAGIGIVIGLVLGALTPALLSATYGEALPIALAVEPHPLSLLTAAGAGLLTMLLFVLLPLGRAKVVPPAVLMRSHLTDEQERPPLAFIVTAAASGLALFALAIAASEERAITLSISAGIVGGFLLLLGFGWLLQKLAARFRRTKPPAWRARAREHRRPWLDRAAGCGLARARPRLPRRYRPDRALADGRVPGQHSGRRSRLLFPRHRRQGPPRLPRHGEIG